MTECPKCKGYGIVGSAVPDILRGRGHIFSSIECPQCHGSGEVQMTNEEWLHTLNTEQLAEWIISLCVTYFDRTDLSIVGAVKESLKINDHYDGHIQKDLLVEWLKQPHTNE